MSKELEEIKTLRGFNQVELNNDKNINKSLDVIEQALQELQAIDNAKPNEALKCLEKLGHLDLYESYINLKVNEVDEFGIIKQALVKAQEQEKILEVLKRIIKVKMSEMYGFELVVRGTDEEENFIKEWLEK